MKRLMILACLILPVAAEAQQSVPYRPLVEVLVDQANRCEQVATEQIKQLQAQVVTLTKERDDLKTEHDKPKP